MNSKEISAFAMALDRLIELNDITTVRKILNSVIEKPNDKTSTEFYDDKQDKT